ncbi:MAG: VHMLp45 [Flaviaesturariibacter sp.]|nr:VHMLp45 [Flaviaesturariibacter sp.]
MQKQPPSLIKRILKWTAIGFGAFIVVGILAVASDDSKPPESKENVVAGASQKARPLYNVTSYFGKTVEQLKKELGRPTEESKPTKSDIKSGITGDASFLRSGIELTVSYDPSSHLIKEFTIADTTYSSSDYSHLLAAAGVNEEDLTYTVRINKSLSDDSKTASVTVIPGQRLSAEQKADRQKTIEGGFSSWDGSHKQLEKYIKDNLNDPGSYEHIKTRYWDQDDHLVVSTEYTAKNAYGGRVRGFVKAKCALDGSVIDILEAQ